MKRLILTVAASLACVAAFAQGKISFANDSVHLVYYGSSAGSLSGQAVSSGNMPLGVTLVADLYGGTSSSSLTLQTTTTFSVTAGRFATVNFTTPSAGPAGTANFFQVQVRDNSAATALEAENAGKFFGFSSIFTTVSGSSLAYNSIVNPNAPANSSWAVGNVDMSAQTGLSGALGAISVGVIPEPSTFALAGLGAAAMLIFRRRK
jgi:hypothetical protein